MTLLLDASADINAVDREGKTALDAAAAYAKSSQGHRRVADLLKERGARNGEPQK